MEMDIQIKTDRFDGPLGLLLLLIQKDEMNIKDIDMTQITKQYLDYLSRIKDLNFDVAGEYLYMAATLLLLKSKSCIEGEEETGLDLDNFEPEITTKAELIKRLESLDRFQKLGQKLWDLPKLGYEEFKKPKVNRKSIVNSILTPLDLGSLTSAMMDYLFRESRKYSVMKRERLSIKEKLREIRHVLVKGETTEFTNLFDSAKGIGDIVLSFISILELAKLKKVSLYQNQENSMIYIKTVDNITDMDVEAADEYESEHNEDESLETAPGEVQPDQEDHQELVNATPPVKTIQ